MAAVVLIAVLLIDTGLLASLENNATAAFGRLESCRPLVRTQCATATQLISFDLDNASDNGNCIDLKI